MARLLFQEKLMRMAPCKSCLAAGRPAKKDVWLSYDEEKDGFEISLHAGTQEVPGLTPHLFLVGKPLSFNSLCVSRLCLMYGCGVSIKRHEKANGVFYEWRLLKEKSVGEMFDHTRLATLREFPISGYELNAQSKTLWSMKEIMAEIENLIPAPAPNHRS